MGKRKTGFWGKAVRLFKKAVKKPKPKVEAPAPDLSKTPDGVMERMRALYPVIATSDSARQQSWKLFARKVSQAYEQNTTVFCVTVNPDILENRDSLAEKFPCQVCSPTEALNSGGFDSIMMQ